MFYKVSKRDFLLVRKNILFKAIPILEAQGFEKSPFSTSWFGRDNTGSFEYVFVRLSNSHLEQLLIQICRGDRWIQVYLNIFELYPTPKTLSELRGLSGMKFNLPPANRTSERLDDLPKCNAIKFIFAINRYKLKRFITHSGYMRRQKKVEKLLKRDFENIDQKIAIWHQLHKPMKTTWEGTPIP